MKITDGKKMANNQTKPTRIAISDIFKDVEYIVPIYQRNYAWKAKQIEQLIEDINSAKDNYYLGTLIVNQKEQNVYEVIDGQQRLTTLYLLKLYLLNNSNKEVHIYNKAPLQFEAREKYHNTLLNLKKGNRIDEEFDATELYDGYVDIKKYFKNNSNKIDKTKFIEKLKKVFLVRVQVPKDIDLNHYFEIMNTRGEQLELHQIVKAKILAQLDDNKDKQVAAFIWDSCANMDSYIQMSFDKATRNKLFSDNWSNLKENIKDWETLKEYFSYQISEEKNPTLRKILEKTTEYKIESNINNEDVDNERFESVISFPNFILQVNAVIFNDEDDTSLDDKNFIQVLKNNWESADAAKLFIIKMLECRVLFDKYILKREYAKDYQKTGKWSLQKLEKYKDIQRNNAEKPLYKVTDVENADTLRTLESALRITYTSPKTMHWITLVLKKLLEDENINLVELLEQYCLRKIDEADYKNKNGFNIERIVFSYLDYLLYRDNYKGITKNDWEFQFRNPIEHFYPQHPDNEENWNKNDLDGFGNLALITVSGNSKFSNMPPSAKIDYKEIIKQSLKLQIMMNITKNNNKIWTPELAEEHKKEMIKILDNNGI